MRCLGSLGRLGCLGRFAGRVSRKRLYGVRMIPVNQLVPRALAEILRKAPLSEEKVRFAWRSAVGPVVDKATAIELRGGVLVVGVKDATWQREIERSAGVIRARLDALLGAGVVRYIEVTVGWPAESRALRAAAPPRADSAPDSAATPARSGSATAAVEPARSADRSAGESGTGRRGR
jgi:hypothetical protein